MYHIELYLDCFMGLVHGLNLHGLNPWNKKDVWKDFFLHSIILEIVFICHLFIWCKSILAKTGQEEPKCEVKGQIHDAE